MYTALQKYNCPEVISNRQHAVEDTTFILIYFHLIIELLMQMLFVLAKSTMWQAFCEREKIQSSARAQEYWLYVSLPGVSLTLFKSCVIKGTCGQVLMDNLNTSINTLHVSILQFALDSHLGQQLTHF